MSQMNKKIYLCCDEWTKENQTPPLQIQLCPRDMTADIITVDIASRNLVERRDCCAEFSTCEIRGSQLPSYRAEWDLQTPVCSGPASLEK